GVNRPSGTNVSVSTSYPSLSQASTPKYAMTEKVGVLIGNGFNSNEVTNTINYLKEQGVFVVIVSETLNPVTGSDGTKLQVNETFLISSSLLFDSIYVVGGSANNQAKFNNDVMSFVNSAYTQYKPIGVASTGRTL